MASRFERLFLVVACSLELAVETVEVADRETAVVRERVVGRGRLNVLERADVVGCVGCVGRALGFVVLVCFRIVCFVLVANKNRPIVQWCVGVYRGRR